MLGLGPNKAMLKRALLLFAPVLSCSSHDPSAVEPFLPKCFPGVKKLGCVKLPSPQHSPARDKRAGSRTDTPTEGLVEGGSISSEPAEPAPAPPVPPKKQAGGANPGLAAFLPGFVPGGHAGVGPGAGAPKVWGGPRIESLISNEGEVLNLRTIVDLQVRAQ